MDVPTLTDGVVTLRAHHEDDVPRMVEQCRDPASIAWTTVPVPYSAQDARSYGLEILPRGWADGSEWGVRGRVRRALRRHHLAA